jgi:hypothetical protein
MDSDLSPDIPVAAYLNAEADDLLRGAHMAEKRNACIVVDRAVAAKVGGSNDEGELAARGFRRLGEWGKKGIKSDAYSFELPESAPVTLPTSGA